MRMKKCGRYVVLVLSLLLSISINPVIPTLAESSEDGFSTNMTDWRSVTGEWDFSTGEAKSTVSMNQAICQTSVSAEDNWMWNVDVAYTDSREDTGHYYYLRFGYQADSGPYYFLQICATAASNQIALYYFDGSKNTRVSGWMAFPGESDPSKFRVQMSVTNKVCYLVIDGNYLGQADVSGSYAGGYFGVANNKFASRFNNVNLYVNDEDIDVYAGYFCASLNGYKTLEATRKWNQAYVSDVLKGKYFIFEADYRNNGGNNQAYFRFGMQDDSNYYYLNMQPDNTAAAFSIYEMSEGSNNRKSAWVAGPAGYDKDSFHIQLIVTAKRCRVYIDDVPIIDCEINFNGGRFGLATYYTAAEFNNFSLARSAGERTSAITAGGGAQQLDGAASFKDTGWARAALAVQSNQNVMISVDISGTGTNKQYYLYFGASGAGAGDGYSVRLQLGEETGENNVVVYDNAANNGRGARVSAWCAFPDEVADRNSFTLTLKYQNGIARVYIEGQYLFSTSVLTPVGAYTELVAYKSLGTVSNLVVGIPEVFIGDVNADDRIDGMDLVRLRKGLVDSEQVMDQEAANCNGDNAVNVKDLVRLKKYRSGKILSVENDMTFIDAGTEENYSYAQKGSFEPGNTGLDFDSERPYVYLNEAGSSRFENGTIGQTLHMGVYVTRDYTVQEVGIITADGDHTASISELVIDSPDINVTRISLPESGDFQEYKVGVSGLGADSLKTIRAYIKVYNAAGESVFFYSTGIILSQ